MLFSCTVGKSTFSQALQSKSVMSWVRVNQDSISKGKNGTRPQCIKAAAAALSSGSSVIIDRCVLISKHIATTFSALLALPWCTQCSLQRLSIPTELLMDMDDAARSKAWLTVSGN